MVQMAHHLPNNNPHGQHSQPSFLAVRRPVNFPSVSRREYGQLSPEELLTYNRELAKARESETQEWIARQKGLDLNSMRPDAKRELMAQSEEVRKHLEKDAYFRANQEYLRLMNDEPSRQTFREKQRLTEDLEKQKRLLIEDLARDQQLKQDKYKRNNTQAYPTDLRTLRYFNEKSVRELPLPLRIKPEAHMPPFPGIDPRYPQHLTTAEDFHNYRRMQENMLKAKQFHAAKHPLDPRHCSHSDFTSRVPQELGPIIQEKEKRIKEMEEKLVRLEQEEKIHFLKKIEAANQLQQKDELMHPRPQQPSVYRPSTTSSPPNPVRTHSPPSSKESHSSHSVSSLCNNNEQLLIDKRELYHHRETPIIDNNNNTITSEKNTKNEQTTVKMIEKHQPAKKDKPHSPAENSNSSNDGLVIDMTDEKHESSKNEKEKDNVEVSQKNEGRASPPKLSRSDSNCIKIETAANTQDDNVTTEVVDDDKSFNELKYGAVVHVSPIMDDKSITMTTGQNNEDDDETDSKNGGDSQEQDGNDPSNVNRIQKKKKGQKFLGKKEESSSPPDFQASQNRLALDLPGHNWLEKRLMQQSIALTTNEIPNNTREGGSDSNEEDGGESKIKVLSYVSLREPNQQPISAERNRSPSQEMEVKAETEFVQNENKNSTMVSTAPVTRIENKTVQKTSSMSYVEQKEQKSKDPPHSELLLKMLDPNKATSQITSPTRINPPSSSISATITSNGMSPVNSPEKLGGKFVTQINGSRKSPIVINDLSSSAPPLLTNGNVTKISPRSEEPRLRSNSDSKIPEKAKPDVSYQEVRPNLVVERRKDTENAQLPFILPKTHQYVPHPSENMPYSKFIVEERYNRKRPMDEATREDHEAALKRAEFSERFFSDLERGMSSKGKTEMTVLGEHKDSRLPGSESVPATLHRHSMEELSTKERLAKMEGTDYNYLSRFKESNSQPPLSYKAPDLVLKSPTASRIPKAASEYSVPHHLKRQTSPQHLSPAAFRSHEEKISIEKALHRRGASADGLPPVLNGRLDTSHLLPPHHRHEGVDPLLLSNLQTREREMKILEEARRREELHRSAIEAAARKERLLTQSVPVGKLQTYKPLPSPEEQFLNLNEKVRTVEDLRALQMGMPLTNGFQRYIRPAQVLRNERLTEREKLALREADLIHQASIRQDGMTSRQDIHNAYLKHARRKASVGGKLTSPTSTSSATGLPHTFSEEQIRIASIRRQQQEEEEKFRSAHERIQLGGEQREQYSISKEMESTHFDPTIPRFFSHKIPRTRDGSLDFGRSKPVDYSFLDYSNPSFREREAAMHNPLKRPSSAHTSSETVAKLQRRSPPQEFLTHKHRLSDGGGVKHPGRSEVNPYEEKWRVLEGSEKRFCSICNKDAQYLCSGCRRVWYCSQDCQLNAWKTHSKTCTLAAER